MSKSHAASGRPTQPRSRKKKPVHPLIERDRALEKTRAKFEGKPLELGRTDCIRAIRYHLVQMGHRNLPLLPRYSTAVGARLALQAQGVETLAALMDKFLEAIPPAMMLPGDICMPIAAESGDDDDGFGEALGISLGQKVWGWHPDAVGPEVLAIDLSAIGKAWRA